MAELLGARTKDEASKSDGIIRILSSFSRRAFLILGVTLLASLWLNATDNRRAGFIVNRKLARSASGSSVAFGFAAAGED
jgi:hypothetical protein